MLRILPLFMMWLVATVALAGDTIRSFSLPTIVTLGIKLYQQDKTASDAFDFLFNARPEAKKLPLRGWITQYDATAHRVFVLQSPDNEHAALAYTVTLLPDGSAKIAEGRGAPLPDFVAKRYAARQAAIAAMPKFAPGRNYNFEVLDDPENKGGFCDGLASSNDPDEVVVGGHYRVTVSANGTVKQVDALENSFLVVSKHRSGPKDAKPVGVFMSHTLSATPVETHVYLSILHQTPLFVSTSESDLWKVSEGLIYKIDPQTGPKPERTFDLKSDIKADPRN